MKNLIDDIKKKLHHGLCRLRLQLEGGGGEEEPAPDPHYRRLRQDALQASQPGEMMIMKCISL